MNDDENKLSNFPLESFDEFKNKYDRNEVYLWIDRAVALKWATSGGMHASRGTVIMVSIMTSIPVLTMFIYLIVQIIQKHWLNLFLAPLLYVGNFIYHPTSELTLGPIRKIIIFLTFLSPIILFVIGNYNIASFFIYLIIICIFVIWTYRVAIILLGNAAIRHEELFIILWNHKAIKIKDKKGNIFAADYKIVLGKIYHYKDTDSRNNDENS